MKIFTPAQKDTNSFFDEITFHSEHEYVHGALGDDTTSYDTILIQWPEQIFNWKEPNNEQLTFLSQEIKKWKQRLKVIYIVHNEKPHLGMTTPFQKLYDLIESSSDILLHFGTYSKERFQKKYPNSKHKILHHPLYKRSFPWYTKEEARKQLGIDQEREVMIAPGKIRTLTERNLVLGSFENIKNPNRTLIVPTMFWKQSTLEFKGRQKLKSIFDIKTWVEKKMNGTFVPPAYILNYGFMNANQLALSVAASDVVFIPRIDTLNSGNMYLGLTQKKISVGPETGNITEELNNFDFPVFQPENPESIKQAIEKGFDLSKRVDQVYKSFDLKAYEPKNIAVQLDQIIKNG